MSDSSDASKQSSFGSRLVGFLNPFNVLNGVTSSTTTKVSVGEANETLPPGVSGWQYHEKLHNTKDTPEGDGAQPALNGNGAPGNNLNHRSSISSNNSKSAQHAKQYSYADFANKMKHPDASAFAKQLKEFVKATESRDFKAEKEQICQEIHTFVDSMYASIERHHLWKGASVAEMDNVLESLEKFCTTKLYVKLFAGTPDQMTENERVSEKLHSLAGWLTIEHLDIPSVYQDPTAFNLAQQELRNMDTFKSPRDKMVCFLNSCRVIINLLKKVQTLETARQAKEKAEGGDGGLSIVAEFVRANDTGDVSNNNNNGNENDNDSSTITAITNFEKGSEERRVYRVDSIIDGIDANCAHVWGTAVSPSNITHHINNNSNNNNNSSSSSTMSRRNSEMSGDRMNELSELSTEYLNGSINTAPGGVSQGNSPSPRADAGAATAKSFDVFAVLGSTGAGSGSTESITSTSSTSSLSEEEREREIVEANKKRNKEKRGKDKKRTVGFGGSADNFLPLFIFMLIKACPPHLHLNIEYIKLARHPSKLVAEAFYYFTHLVSSLAFVMTIDHTHLSIEEKEYTKEVTRALGLYRLSRLSQPPSEFALSPTASAFNGDRGSLSGGGSSGSGSGSAGLSALKRERSGSRSPLAGAPSLPVRGESIANGFNHLEHLLDANLVSGGDKSSSSSSSPPPPASREISTSTLPSAAVSMSPNPFFNLPVIDVDTSMAHSRSPLPLSSLHFASVTIDSLRVADVEALLKEHQALIVEMQTRGVITGNARK